jgi:hypothetical protein
MIDSRLTAQARSHGREAQRKDGKVDFRAVLGDGTGDLTVPGSDHIFWIRQVLSETNGVTEYGTPEPALAAGANIVMESGFPVIVGYDRGVAIITKPDAIEMVRRKNNPNILIPHNPYNKFFNMRNADLGWSGRIGTGNTKTLEVMIKPLYYQDDGGAYHTAGNVQINLASYVPAADGSGNDQHLIAGLFVDTSNNIVVVTSTAKSVDLTLSHTTDLAEVFANAPARALAIRAFVLRTGQTLIEDTDTFSDIRMWLRPPPRKNNFSSTIAPTITDDIDSGYEVGSKWIDTDSRRSWINVDSTVGAADWLLEGFENAKVLYVDKNANDTTGDNKHFNTIQGAVDWIETNDFGAAYIIYVGVGAFAEPITLDANNDLIQIIGSSQYRTFIDGAISVSTSSASAYSVRFDKLGFSSSAAITINFAEETTTKQIKFKECNFNGGSLSVTGTKSAFETGIHLIQLHDCLVRYLPVFNSCFLDSLRTGYGLGFTLNGIAIAQHFDAEINGTITCNDTSILVMRNSGAAVDDAVATLFTLTIQQNDTSVINIDSQTEATTRILGDRDYVQSITGFSAGVVSPPPTLTDNGDTTIDLSSCAVFIYDNSTHRGIPRRYVIAADTLTLTSEVNNYIHVDFNSGTPIFVTSTTDVFNDSDKIPIYVCYLQNIRATSDSVDFTTSEPASPVTNETYVNTVTGTSSITATSVTANVLYRWNGSAWITNADYEVHDTEWDALGEGLNNKIHERIIKTNRFARESGLVLGETGTPSDRTLTITAGVAWFGAVDITLPAIDSSTSDVEEWYKSGGSWTLDHINQYNNTEYQNGANKATMIVNRYSWRYVWKSAKNETEAMYILGTAQYATEAAAQADTLPSDLPPKVQFHGILVGRILIQNGGSTSTTIESAFDTTFETQGVTNHNDLSGLQGGTASEYYHITATDDTNLNTLTDGVSDASSLHNHDSVYVSKSGDTSTGTQQIDVATATDEALVLRSTDDSSAIAIQKIINAANTTQFLILNNGTIARGVGDTIPSVGLADVAAYFESASTIDLAIDAVSDAGITLLKSNTPRWRIRNDGAGAGESNALITSAGLTTPVVLSLMPSGKVGINTDSPSESLDVSTGKLILANGTGINEFSTDGTLAGDSDDAVPTEKAVKAYADALGGGNLVHVETKSLSQATNTTFSGLSGIKRYFMRFELDNDTGTIAQISFRINGDSGETDYVRQGLNADDTTISGGRTVDSSAFTAAPANQRCFGYVHLGLFPIDSTPTAYKFAATAFSLRWDGADDPVLQNRVMGKNTNVSAITAIEVVSNQTNSMNGEIALYEITS